MEDNKKVMLIGCGMVGMSYAYALLFEQIVDELVLVDVVKKKAEGEAMDLNHSLAFAPSSIYIHTGDYSDAKDADLIVIAAGVNQKEGESRLDLLSRNYNVFKSIISPVIDSGFNGIFLIATNPVDIMTMIVQKLSNFPSERVIGSGTTLDTARLRYLLGASYAVDPRNVHAYVIGEHGESEFVPWSQAHIATTSIEELEKNSKEPCKKEERKRIETEVRTSANKIIKSKKATYYGIGTALVRITKAIFSNENSVLTVSSNTSGAFDLDNVSLGLPRIIGRNGVVSLLPMSLKKEEEEKLRESASIVKDAFIKITKNDN